MLAAAVRNPPPKSAQFSLAEDSSLLGEAELENHSLLEEIDKVNKPCKTLVRRLKKVFPGCNFDSGQAVVLPTARTVDLWRDPDDWKIVPSPGGARIQRTEMRSLALYACDSMIPELLQFVRHHADALHHFSIVTSEVLRPQIAKLLGKKGLLLGCSDHVNDRRGGLALFQTRIVLESIGAAIVFNDCSESALHSDFASTYRLLNVVDVPTCTNRSSADAMMTVLDQMVKMREPELVPTFFVTLESPAVPAYKAEQAALIESLKEPTANAAKRTGSQPANSSQPVQLVAVQRTESSLRKLIDEDPDELLELSAATLKKVAKEAEKKALGESEKGQSGESKSESDDVAPWEATSAASRLLKRLHSAKIVPKLSIEPPPMVSQSESTSSVDRTVQEYNIPRDSMRCLALISHNHMKEEMKKFVIGHKEVLRGFRLTGTASTMKMLSEVLGTDDLGGFKCSSGPLGGDAQVGAFICLNQIGGVIFFTDPLSAHPHQADIEFLHRVINQQDVLHATNPSCAHVMITLLKKALDEGDTSLIPTFRTKRAGTPSLRLVGKLGHWARAAKDATKERRASTESLESDEVPPPTVTPAEVPAASNEAMAVESDRAEESEATVWTLLGEARGSAWLASKAAIRLDTTALVSEAKQVLMLLLASMLTAIAMAVQAGLAMTAKTAKKQK